MNTINAREIVKEYILKNIREGRYRIGERIETVREIARSSKASAPTVSRAIQELARTGLLRAEQGRGCFLAGNRLGDSNQPSTQTLGILVLDRAFPDGDGALGDCVRPIQNRFFRDEYNLLFLRGLDSIQKDYPYVPPRRLGIQGLSGLIVLALYDLLYLAELKAFGTPLVALDVDASSILVDSVTFDNVASSARLVRELHTKGARRIAMFGGPYQARPGKLRIRFDPCAFERMQGWRSGMETCGLQPEPALCWDVDERTTEAAELSLRRNLVAGRIPDAIMTEFPDLTMKVLRENGLEGGVLVAGWDAKSKACKRPRMDVEALCDFEALGRVGSEVLQRRMQGEDGTVVRELIAPEIWLKGTDTQYMRCGAAQ